MEFWVKECVVTRIGNFGVMLELVWLDRRKRVGFKCKVENFCYAELESRTAFAIASKNPESMSRKKAKLLTPPTTFFLEFFYFLNFF